MPRLMYLEVTGHRDAQGRFARASREHDLARREEMRELGRRIVNVVREEAPIRIGTLRQGIGFKTHETAVGVDLSITSAAKHTMWVIRGRGPVVAKHALALRFEPGPPGSGFIFRKRVGPSKPNPFVQRALGKLGQEPARVASRISRRIERAYSLM